MNVLSLCDGSSTGRIALEEEGINVDKYYTSEIDKYASAVSRHLFKDNIEIGDIRDIDTSNLSNIDIVIAGFPCTDLSISGKQRGLTTIENIDIVSLDMYLKLKKGGFEFNGQSYLFWEVVRIINETNPKFFFIENVVMKGKAKKWKETISNTLGCEPYQLNSSLVSGQNRDRLYWTNIPGITEPEDRGILLGDLLQDDMPIDKSGLKILTNVNPSKKGMNGNVHSSGREKMPTLTTNKGEGIKVGCVQVGEADIKGFDSIKRVYSPKGKCPTITTMQGGHREPKVAIYGAAIRGRYNGDGKIEQKLEINGKEKSNTITTVQKDALATDGVFWRKLTPIECERGQTLPDNTTKYGVFDIKGKMITKEVSNSQRYKIIGNGWTKDMIRHFFSFLPEKYKNK